MLNLKARGIIKWGSSLLIIMVLLISSFACSGYFNILIENQTTQELTIYLDEYKVGRVDSGGQITLKHLPINVSTYLIVAKNAGEEAVFSQNFTRQQTQLVDKNTYNTYKVVIPALDEGAKSSNTTVNK